MLRLGWVASGLSIGLHSLESTLHLVLRDQRPEWRDQRKRLARQLDHGATHAVF